MSYQRYPEDIGAYGAAFVAQAKEVAAVALATAKGIKEAAYSGRTSASY